MKTIKLIVVGVDFSDYSPEILEYASSIAELHSAEIIAVNVINKRQIESLEEAFNSEHSKTFSVKKFLSDETRKRTRDLDDLIKKWVAEQVSTRATIRTGVPFEEILKVVDEENADLLIINSRGRSTFRDYIYGTTAEKIFRHSPVSLLCLNLSLIE